MRYQSYRLNISIADEQDQFVPMLNVTVISKLGSIKLLETNNFYHGSYEIIKSPEGNYSISVFTYIDQKYHYWEFELQIKDIVISKDE